MAFFTQCFQHLISPQLITMLTTPFPTPVCCLKFSMALLALVFSGCFPLLLTEIAMFSGFVLFFLPGGFHPFPCLSYHLGLDDNRNTITIFALHPEFYTILCFTSLAWNGLITFLHKPSLSLVFSESVNDITTI